MTETLISVAVMPWRFWSYIGWLTFVLPQLAMAPATGGQR